MDFDKLVELITKELMKKMKEAGLKLLSEDMKKILVLDNVENEAYKNVQHKLQALNYEVESFENMSVELENYEAVIITGIDNRELANLALGVQCGRKEQLVIDSILKGKRVYLLEDGIDYRKYKNSSNKVFYNLYEQYEEKLVSYGIVVDSFENLLINRGDNSSSKCECTEKITEHKRIIEDKSPIIEKSQSQSSISVQLKDKKLLSETDLKRVYRTNVKEVLLSNSTIITPLARDFARMNHIVLVKES